MMVMAPAAGLRLKSHGKRRALKCRAHDAFLIFQGKTLKDHIITGRAHRARRRACRAQNNLSRSGPARPSRSLTFPTTRWLPCRVAVCGRGARDPFVTATRGANPWLYVRGVGVPRKTGADVPCPVDDGAVVVVVDVVVTATEPPTETGVAVATAAPPRAPVAVGVVTVAATLGDALAGDVTVTLGDAAVAVALEAAGAGPASGRIVTACQAY